MPNDPLCDLPLAGGPGSVAVLPSEVVAIEAVDNASAMSDPMLRHEYWPGRTFRLRVHRRVTSSDDIDDPVFAALLAREVGLAVADGRIYEDHEIDLNGYGAVSVLANDGRHFGLRPAEFEWLSAPPWPEWPADPPCGFVVGGGLRGATQ